MADRKFSPQTHAPPPLPHSHNLDIRGVSLPFGKIRKLRYRKNVCIWRPPEANTEIKIQVHVIYWEVIQEMLEVGWKSETKKRKKLVMHALMCKFPLWAAETAHKDLGGQCGISVIPRKGWGSWVTYPPNPIVFHRGTEFCSKLASPLYLYLFLLSTNPHIYWGLISLSGTISTAHETYS